MSAPRKRWVCSLCVGTQDATPAITLTFPPTDTPTVPTAVSALAMASPPPVITIEWIEETPDAR